MSAEMADRAAEYFRALQDRIVAALEEADGRGRFREDRWEREGGGKAASTSPTSTAR